MCNHMRYRTLGKTGYKVSEVSYGAWSLGADWGNVSDDDAMATLHAAVDAGVNFIDTADVYGDGRSEKRIARLLRERNERLFVATKAGRRLNPHVSEGYTEKNLNEFADRSLKNLGVQTIDLLQLHCPPTRVYYMPEVFDALDRMVKHKKIRFYGVSVEKVEEGLKALEYPGVSTVQIIFNMFRQRPAGLFFEQAKKNNVGIIVRVPLASGLLTGKMTQKTVFSQNDHRLYNRHGASFDVGETFAGVDFDTGISAVKSLEKLKPSAFTMPQFALKWILMHNEISTVIPGGKTPQQVNDNTKASDLPRLKQATMKKVEKLYIDRIKPQVHHRW